MKTSEIKTIVNDAFDHALEQTLSQEGLEGVSFTATFKKTPALEIKSVYGFRKGEEVEKWQLS